jgi:hypothetical protein
MAQVAIIDTKLKKLLPFNSKESDLSDAFAFASLKKGEVDFGSIAEGYFIIVYEFGLMKGKQDEYFRLGTQLFNGNAILFHSNEDGATIDLPSAIIDHLNQCTMVEFFPSIDSIEEAIEAGHINRPQNSINGEIFWEWNR